MENQELWPGTCMAGGTPCQPELQKSDKSSIYAYLMNKFEQEMNDKENSFSGKKSPKKMLNEKNGMKSPRKDSTSTAKSKLDIVNYNELRKKLVCCTGNITCPVHWKSSDTKWSFYSESEDIEKLIQSLNKRGCRERELRNNLIQESQNLVEVINECPKYKLNSDLVRNL